MKTYLTYGFFMALAGLLLVLALFFLGFHSDPAKLSSAQWIGSLGGLAIGIVTIVLGTKARREEIPPSEAFGYGRALGAGVMIGLVGSFLGIFTNYAYMQFINPGMADLIIQAQVDKLEAKGLSGAQLEQAEKMTRMMIGPVISSCFSFVGGVFFCTVISLITGAILKRPAKEEVPPVAA